MYDAYGTVIARDDPATPATGPPELRVGHKGLFFDRLDAGIFDLTQGRETPRLAPGARLSGYARNRTLHCDFGRWNQPDPNATGLPVQATIAFHGEAPSAWVQSFDLGSHFGDGPNTREYLGSMAWNASDPTGLFFGIAGSAFSMGMNAWDFASDTLETAQIGLRGGFGLASMISDYMTMQLDDAYWASDWSAHDAANYAGNVAFEAWGVSMNFGGDGGGGDASPAMAAKYHKNSLKSRAKNRGYVIEKYNPVTGKWEIQKYGITAQGLNPKGVTLRGQYQVNKLNDMKNGRYRTSNMGQFANRRQAAEWERQMARDYWNHNGHNPPLQRRPSGRP